jgi:valyl-tRNA synthetase
MDPESAVGVAEDDSFTALLFTPEGVRVEPLARLETQLRVDRQRLTQLHERLADPGFDKSAPPIVKERTRQKAAEVEQSISELERKITALK